MRILFVENHETFAQMAVARFLSEHEVVLASSLSAAKSCFEGASFDVVLVDYDLDDGKGSLLVTWLRKRFSGRIIAVSAHEGGNQALLDAGADASCPKMEFGRISPLLKG